MTRTVRRIAPVEPTSPDDLPSREDLQKLIETMERGIEAFQPGVDALVSLVAKLTALCKWITGVKPWAIGVGVWVLTTYAPDLAKSLGPLLQSLGAAG